MPTTSRSSTKKAKRKTKRKTRPKKIVSLLRECSVKYLKHGKLKLNGESVMGLFDPYNGIEIEKENGDILILQHEVGHMWANDHVRALLYAKGYTKKQVFDIEEVFVNMLPLYIEICKRNDIL